MELEGATGVVTGAASGIGRAVATHLAGAGVKVVASDIEEPPLVEAVEAITASGGEAVARVTDVSSWEDVEGLRRDAEAAYGGIDIVMNNAGVAGNGAIAECSLETWQWTLGVNLFGVVHGMKSFLPGMIERGRGHIVNTSSIAGHVAWGGMGPYCTSKFAVAAMTESLQQEMLSGATGVGVSLLCPGFVATNIIGSDRNRPEHLMADDDPLASSELRSAVADAYAAQLAPERVAEMVADAVRENTFWIFTDDMVDEQIAERHRDIQTRTTPGPRRHLIEFIL